MKHTLEAKNKTVPSIKEMLEVGESCELSTVKEAVSNYLNHYDCFFYIPEYAEQYNQFLTDLVSKGFATTDNDPYVAKLEIVDMKISDALAMCRNEEE